MFESLWEQLKIQFPFSDLQIEVLRSLHLSPTQLHPNGWGSCKPLKFFARRIISSILQLFSYIFLVPIRVWRRVGYPFATVPGSPNYLFLMKSPLRPIGIFMLKLSPGPKIVLPSGWEKTSNPCSRSTGRRIIIKGRCPWRNWRLASWKKKTNKPSGICAPLLSRGGYPSIVRMW